MAENQYKATILVIEDEPLVRHSVKTYFEDSGYQVISAEDGKQGLALVSQVAVDLVFTDLIMPVMGGLELIAALQRLAPDLPFIVISGAGSVHDAVAALKRGATDYIIKPVHDLASLERIVTKALETGALRRELQQFKQKLLETGLAFPEAFAAITTRSPRLHALFRYLEVVAPTPQPILIQGETGTGKELMARAIHQASRRSGRFVAVNLAGLDDQMFSDTLFGHERGAYTGAATSREGLLAQAAGGTLFLDEIGDLSESSQIKLLRVVQEGEYYPLGADRPKNSTARFVMATHRDLQNRVQEGRFRHDLYYRLCTHQVLLPPLRERTEDIPLLAAIFLQEAATLLQKHPPAAPPSFYDRLAEQPWPGNIRELRALITDAVARHDGGDLLFGTAAPPQSPSSEPALPDNVEPFPTLKAMEQNLIAEALQRTGGNQGMAARLLGISRTALNKRLAKRQIR